MHIQRVVQTIISLQRMFVSNAILPELYVCTSSVYRERRHVEANMRYTWFPARTAHTDMRYTWFPARTATTDIGYAWLPMGAETQNPQTIVQAHIPFVGTPALPKPHAQSQTRKHKIRSETSLAMGCRRWHLSFRHRHAHTRAERCKTVRTTPKLTTDPHIGKYFIPRI